MAAAIAAGTAEIASAHLLLALLDATDGSAVALLRDVGADVAALRDAAGAIAERLPRAEDPSTAPRLAGTALAACAAARRLATNLRSESVAPDHVLVGLATDDTEEARLLAAHGADVSVLTGALLASRERGSTTTVNPQARHLREKYSTDLTELAVLGGLDPVVGRLHEIREMAMVWGRRTRNAVVLIGDRGVGKTAIISGLAQRITAEDAPEPMRDNAVVSLDLRAVLANARSLGEFDELLARVLDDIEDRAGRAVVFLDELQTVSAVAAELAVAASDLLTPLLARPALRLAAAATRAQYDRLVESDEALSRLFQPVAVGPLSLSETLDVLHAVKARYAAHHGVDITDAAVVAAAELGPRYAPGPQPEAAIHLLDAAAARLRMDERDRPLAGEDVAQLVRRSEGGLDPQKPGVPPPSAAAAETSPARRTPAEMTALAASLLTGGDTAGARHWYEKAADAGDADAMYTLATVLEQQVVRQGLLERMRRRHRNGGDLAESELWLRRAAVAGHPDAMVALAALLRRDGQADEAQIWEQRAANAGSAARPLPKQPPPSIIPPAPAPAPANEFRRLLGMVMGNHATAERLIALEQRRTPSADRAVLIARAIDKLQHDRR
nr:Clp protease N-terminal domain-containing protein [Nocardia transvalensis]